jgi:hypothetical protein
VLAVQYQCACLFALIQQGQRSQYDSIPEDSARDDDLTAIDANSRTSETGTAASTEGDNNHAAHAGAGNTVNVSKYTLRLLQIDDRY